MLKYQNHWNCVENVWQFINARRLTCINIFYGLSHGKWGREERGEGCMHVCWTRDTWKVEAVERRTSKCEKSNKRPQRRQRRWRRHRHRSFYSYRSRIAQHFVVVFIVLCWGSWLPFCFESHKKECRLLLLLSLLLLLWPATCACFFSLCLSSLFLLYFASARCKSHSKRITTQMLAKERST